MTTPEERSRAVIAMGDAARSLSSDVLGRVGSRAIANRQRVLVSSETVLALIAALRHYPHKLDLLMASRSGAAHVFGIPAATGGDAKDGQ